MLLLQIGEISTVLIQYGALGVIVILMAVVIRYQSKQIDKKDAQIIDIAVKSSEGINSAIMIMESLNSNSTKIPERVQMKLKEDFHSIEKVLIENKRK